MESAKLSQDELINLISESIYENNMQDSVIDNKIVKKIIRMYDELCDYFKYSYLSIGELDTFKRAACLLVAINRHKLSQDERVNASIAIDAAYKMCEKPYWNVGERYNIPKKLEEVNFKEAFKDDMETYNYSKNLLIESLINGDAEPLNYYLNLELFYKTALLYKKYDNNNKREQNQINNIETQNAPTLKKKIKKLFNIL